MWNPNIRSIVLFDRRCRRCRRCVPYTSWRMWVRRKIWLKCTLTRIGKSRIIWHRTVLLIIISIWNPVCTQHRTVVPLDPNTTVKLKKLIFNYVYSSGSHNENGVRQMQETQYNKYTHTLLYLYASGQYARWKWMDGWMHSPFTRQDYFTRTVNAFMYVFTCICTWSVQFFFHSHLCGFHSGGFKIQR